MYEKEDEDAIARIRRRSSAVPGGAGLELTNSGGTHGGGRGRSRERKRQPSLLSRIMHPGPALPREYSSARRSNEMDRNDEGVMSSASGRDLQPVVGP